MNSLRLTWAQLSRANRLKALAFIIFGTTAAVLGGGRVYIYFAELLEERNSVSELIRNIAALEKTFGPEHPNVAISLDKLGELYYSQNQFAKAELLYQRALAIREKALDPEDPEIAHSLGKLAMLYYTLNQRAKAESLNQRAMAVMGKAYSPERLAEQPKELVSASALMDDIAALEKTLGPEHPDVATSVDKLAELYEDRDQHAEAEPLYQKSLAIREKALGPEHPKVVTSLINLAKLYEAQGKYTKAEPLYQQAITISEKAPARKNNLDLPAILNSLASLYSDQAQYAKGRAALSASAGNTGKGACPRAPRS